MPDMLIEFTDDALVRTEFGYQRLADLLHRPVDKSLWAIKWKCKGNANGISFHKSHKAAKDFANSQTDCEVDGHARLITVSDELYEKVQKLGYYWTNLSSFEEAELYKEEKWNH